MNRLKLLLCVITMGALILSFSACSIPGLPGMNTQNPAGQNPAGQNSGNPGQGNAGNNGMVTAAPANPTEEPDFGIEYVYWLRLEGAFEQRAYETVCKDVNYSLTDYGNYITVYITNNGTEEVPIGGKYRLQRLIDGEYTDLEDNVNMFYGDTNVMDMPLIILHDEADDSEIVLADEEEEFLIAPGQIVKAEFLTLRYPIFDDPEYAGDYRLVYGEAGIDFKLYCDIAC